MSYSLKVYLIGIVIWGSILSSIVGDTVLSFLNVIMMILLFILVEVSKLNNKT